MGFSRQEYWSGLPCPSPGDLPDPGIKPRSPALQVDSLLFEPPGKPIYTHMGVCVCVCVCVCTHNGILLSQIKNEIMPFAAAWMNLEIIIISEVRQRQISYDITYMWNVKK